MVVQLEQILDDLYRRFNRLKINDLEKGLREDLKTTISDTAQNKQDVAGLKVYRAEATEKANETERRLRDAGIDKGIDLDEAKYPIHSENVNITNRSVKVKGELEAEGSAKIDAADGYLRIGGTAIGNSGTITAKRILTSEQLMKVKGLNIPVIISLTQPEEKGVIWINPGASMVQYTAVLQRELLMIGKEVDIGFPVLMRSGNAISGANCLYMIELAVKNKARESESTDITLYAVDQAFNRYILYSGTEGHMGPNDVYYINAKTTLENITGSEYLYLHLVLKKSAETTTTISAGTKITLTCVESGTNNCEVKFLS